MIATHTMKINGIYYRAGEEIPSPADTPVQKPVEVETVVEEPHAEEPAKVEYTKTDIMSMKAAKLREIAADNGVENPEELTGGELKKLLIEKFGL